jgi:arylsulfatase A-like enzyme
MYNRIALLAAVAAVACPLASQAAAATKQPNIVFIFSDDHTPQTIGAYNLWLSPFCREQKVTPNIDRLAAAGAVFPNSFCGNSICSPSRGAVLTGLHGHANGVRYLGEEVTLGTWKFPTALRAAGYQTAVIGKWHLGATTSETDFWCLLPGQGAYNDPSFTSTTGAVQRAGHASDVITDLSLEWLESRDRAKPFMLMVHHKAPHRNWVPPERHAHFLDDVAVPEPANLFDDYANRASVHKTQKLMIDADMTLSSDLKIYPDKPLDKIPEMYRARNEAFRKLNPQGQDLVRWKYQTYLKDYLRCVKSVDDGVGRVLDYLDKNGLANNTVVIYSADQGFFIGEHGWFDKRWILEESIHMPFIVRWPGVVQPGARPAAMIQNIDYAPTFVEIAGGQTPSGLHGRSFLPILRGETPADWRTSVFYRYYDPGHGVPQHLGVRTDRYTLAHYSATDEWELFDREKDPAQMRSVIADPAYADTVKALKAELARLRALYGETDPEPYVRAAKAAGERPARPVKAKAAQKAKRNGG